MDEWIKVVILGIVEGITEFLPISSTGHLIIASEILELRESLSGVFEIFIQLGAVFAVLWFYRTSFLQQAKIIHRDRATRRLWFHVFMAFIPSAIIGVILIDFIQDKLFSSVVVAVSLIIGGLFFILMERNFSEESHATDSLLEITLRQAILIGIAQCFALVPGVSRSGASIIGGLLSGMNRQTATQFSFYLALPTLGGATLFQFVTNLDELNTSDLWLLLLGTIVSAIVAWVAIGWLLRYVANNDFVMFGYYRIILGSIILILTIL